MPDSNFHPDDIFHVILDGLTALTANIEAGAQPWDGYSGDDDDPKTSRDTYEQVLANATTFATSVLDDQGRSEQVLRGIRT